MIERQRGIRASQVRPCRHNVLWRTTRKGGQPQYHNTNEEES